VEAVSRTADAIKWLDADRTRTAYQAAKLFCISQSAISQSKARRSNVACPSCGAVFTLADARRIKGAP